jgi:Flp pilus assembly protein TadG
VISHITSAKRGGERASAAVEFALVLPLLLILALAIVQVAILVKDELVVVEAARAGARQAAVVSDDDSARQSAVGAATSLDPERIDVTVARDGGAGSPATVTVAYHAPIAVPLVAWLFPQTVELTASAVMRQETG